MRRLMEMQDREQQALALEIHDELLQLLTGAFMHLETARALLGQDPALTRKCFESGCQLLNQAIRRTRRLVNRLRPPSLADAGVAAAVADLIREIGAGGSPNIEFIEFTNGHALGRLPPPLENVVFRIIHECLANAYAHSASEKIQIEVCREGRRLRIVVRDWGLGFNPQTMPAGCFGVDGIRQRATAFGGSTSIESRLGGGTTVTVELPLPEGLG